MENVSQENKPEINKETNNKEKIFTQTEMTLNFNGVNVRVSKKNGYVTMLLVYGVFSVPVILPLPQVLKEFEELTSWLKL